MSYQRIVLSIALTLPLSARAADLPKQGTDTYTITYITAASNTMKLESRSVRTFETFGIARNDSGGVMFNDMGSRCLGSAEISPTEANFRGTCVETDKDGDEIFSTYEGKGAEGTHTFIGGTGKYTGLSGTAAYTARPVKSPDGRSMVIVAHTATWKLPRSAVSH